MDPKTGIPDIKPEVNKEQKKKDRKGGFLARLFGGAEGGAGLGSGAVDITGAAAGGGLLATKAGLIALLLAGTTVAAGIGLVGYRMFGPGQDDNSENNLSLFTAKPKPAADASAGAAGDKDGTSKSLSMLNNANSEGGVQAPAGAADVAVKDQTAADASASSGGSATGPINGTADGGASGGKLTAASKMAPLAGFGSGGGAASGGSSASASASPAKFDPNAGSKGSLTGSGGKSSAARSATASARPGRANGALGQAFGSLGDQAGGRAASSYSAGRTYDGTTASGASTIGPQAGAIGGAGPGDSSAQTAAKSTPNTANPAAKIQAPPTPAATNATPWQGAINSARALVVGALLLLAVRKKIARMMPGPYQMIADRIISGMVAAMGLAVIALGAQVSGGQWGQVTQGQILAAAGVGILAAAAASGFGDKGAGDGSLGADSGIMNDITNGSSIGSTFILVGGGMAAVAVCYSMVRPLQSYPSTDFNNGLAPGQGWFSMGKMPSQDALRRLS